MKNRTIALCVLLSFRLGVCGSEWVELTSTDGRTLEAKVIATTEEEVEIELRNGRRFTLPLSRFSLTSRKQIQEYDAEAPEEKPVRGDTPEPLPVTPRFEFEELDVDESTEDFFTFRTLEAKKGTLPRTAGKVFALMMPRLPGLRDLFERGQFRAPGEGRNPADFDSEDRMFRYTVYVVGDQAAYRKMVNQYADQLENKNTREFFLATAPDLGQFTDFKHRFSVAFDDGNTDMNGLVAHQIGFELVGMTTREPHLPLWLRMGAGYFAEQRLFDRCTVYYVDFQAYEENRYREDAAGGGNVERREVLSHERSWVPVIKRMTRKGQGIGLAETLAAQTGSLSPEQSAYSLALFAFCTSTQERIDAFAKVLELVGKREDPDAKGMAELFGYESVEAFEVDWRDFIESRRFR